MRKIILLLSIVLFTACKKEETKQEPRQITYTVFSEQGKCHIKYYDDSQAWQDIDINQQNYTITVSQHEGDFGLIPTLSATAPDSLYFSAESKDKKIEDNFRAKNGTISLTLNLIDLK